MPFARSSRAWNFRFFSLGDIPVRVHATTMAMLLWVLFEQHRKQEAVLIELLLTAIIFLSLLLHELGHGVFAQIFGVRTHEITLYPYGGSSRFSVEPRGLREMVIGFAGPAVNGVIAITLSLIPDVDNPSLQAMLRYLETVNLLLALLNLLPAFPLDGGRILRGALTLAGVKKSNEIATGLGQLTGVALAGIGLWHLNPIIVIVACVIFVAALAEQSRQYEQELAESVTIREAIVPIAQLPIITHGARASDAVNCALTSLAPHIPVMYGKKLMGLVDRNSILLLAGTEYEREYLSGLLEKDYATILPDVPLKDALIAFDLHGSTVLVVGTEEECHGLLYFDTIQDLLYIKQMRLRKKELEDSGLNDDEIDL